MWLKNITQEKLQKYKYIERMESLSSLTLGLK